MKLAFALTAVGLLAHAARRARAGAVGDVARFSVAGVGCGVAVTAAVIRALTREVAHASEHLGTERHGAEWVERLEE